MNRDQLLPGRRTVLRIAAGLGAAFTVRLLTAEETRTSGSAGVVPATGPQAGVGRAASSYRLQPMTSQVAPGFRRAAPPVRKEPFSEMPSLGRSIVLTFDDGPDPRYTPQILRTLRAHDVRAMFFVCGEMAGYNQDLLREMANDGHLVGNHSWSHPLIPRLAPSGIREELGRTSEMIERTLGTPPYWYRAPYGAWNRLSFEIGAEFGMEPLAWSIDTRDWTTPGTSRIVRTVLESADPGAVVLSHDAGGNRSQSVAALRRYLPELLKGGYSVTVPHP
jgi:peptidoglycan/xylan/chitin deacetylase (PgdA/CDA1 family)